MQMTPPAAIELSERRTRVLDAEGSEVHRWSEGAGEITRFFLSPCKWNCGRPPTSPGDTRAQLVPTTPTSRRLPTDLDYPVLSTAKWNPNIVSGAWRVRGVRTPLADQRASEESAPGNPDAPRRKQRNDGVRSTSPRKARVGQSIPRHSGCACYSPKGYS
jgi:hypothetical protein